MGELSARLRRDPPGQAVADPSSDAASRDHPKYRPDVDGLRAVAVLSVVAFHAAPGRMPGGFVGVDIFFVISGFLISSIIMKSLAHGHFTFADFYSRRIKRIFPALFVTLLVTLAAGYVLLVDDELTALARHIAAGAGFVSNFVLWSESGYFDASADMKPLLHLWSLGIEEQFYIAWPLLLWLATRRKLAHGWVVGLIAAGSFVLNVALVRGSSVAAFYSPLTRFWELLVGAGLASLSLRPTKAPPPGAGLANAASFTGLALLGLVMALVNKGSAFPGWWAVLPTVGTALVIWAGPRAWPNRFALSRKPLVWVGLISFPLYLWHWPALSFLRIIEGTEVAQWKRFVAVAGAFVLAWATYRFVETPLRHRKARRTPFVLFGLVASVGALGAWGAWAGGFGARPTTPQIVNVGDIGHLAFFQDIAAHSVPCTPTEIWQSAASWNGYVRCFQSKADAPLDIALIGDSHAEHLFPGLTKALPDRNIVFYGELPWLGASGDSKIFEHVLADPHIKVVVLAANWSHRLQALPLEQWEHDQVATLSALRTAGKRVFLVEDNPEFSFLPSRCKFAGRLGIDNRCSQPDRPSALADPALLERVAKAVDGLTVLRTRGLFCRGGVCSMAQGGSLLFRDERHLNIRGSILVADSFAQLLEPQ